MINSKLIHPLAIKICQILNDNKYQAFIVGGCVRDLILGNAPKDWDIATDAMPEEILKIFPKTIPTGLQHGTVTVCMAEGVENHFEVTTFRTESKYTDGRRPDKVDFVSNIKDDLARRDLTINAMAYHPIEERIIDPFYGLNELYNGIIRAVGIPEERFQEDGLRIMRVCRFASRFNFWVEESTLEGMKKSIDTLHKISKERISDELSKILMSPHAKVGLDLLKTCGAIYIVCPLLSKSSLFRAGQDRVTGELETRLAFMYSNYYASVAEEELTNLKFSNKEIKKTVFLIQLFEKLYLNNPGLPYKDFIALVKNHSIDSWERTLEEFIRLTEAMGYASKAFFENNRHITVFSRKELQINGNDLIEIGIKPGPEIKRLLDICYLEILNIPEHNNKEFLINFVKDK